MKKFDKSTYSTVLKIGVPSMLESLFVALAGIIDSLMVSTLGSDAVASVGLTTQPKFIGLSLFMATSVALSALVARRFGEKKRDSANSILVTAFAIIFVAAAILSVLFVTFAPNIIRLCGSTADTHDGAVTYLRIIMGGLVFNCIQIGVNSAQRGAGNTKITMRTNITSSIVNVCFNYLLIGGKFGFPALGIAGAAYATVLGTVVASVMSVISLLNPDCFVSIPYIIREKIKPSFESLSKIAKVGYSVVVEQLLMRIGFLATALMAADMGDESMAAHQVVLNIMSLSIAFGDGLQAAAVALIGRSLGENNPEKAKLYSKRCQTIGLCISSSLAIMYIFAAKGIMTLFFAQKPHIISIGAGVIYCMIPAVLFQIRLLVYQGSLRAAGDTLFIAVVSALSVTVIRPVVSYLACYTLGWGIYGIWCGIAADQIARYFMVMIRFKKGKWVKIKI